MKPSSGLEKLGSSRQILPGILPLAGFRNILIHEYLEIDFDEVYQNLQELKDLYSFLDHVREWMKSKDA